MRWTSPRSIPLAFAISAAFGGRFRPSLFAGRSRPSMAYAALGLLPGALGLLPGVANSATITVTTGGDTGSASTCTLRQAIDAANNDSAGASSCSAGAGADTIQFAANLANATITLGGSELTVLQALTIAGNGQTIDANQLSRVLYASTTALAISNVTITGGKTSGSGLDATGAGIDAYNSDVTLTGVHVTGNSAADSGGGVYASGGSLTLSGSTISSNVAAYSGGVEVNASALTIGNSVISANTGTSAGGVHIGYGVVTNTVTISNSSISGNTANCEVNFCVGGLYATHGTVTVVDSTISGNTVNGNGFSYVSGGAYFFNAAATLTNSTVAQNTANGTDYVSGGLSESHYSATGDSLALVNCTVASNNAATTGANANFIGGGLLVGATVLPDYLGALTLSNTILSTNTPAGSDLVTGGANSTVTATFSLLGTALDINPYNTGANKNVFSDAPGLGPLQANGGPAQTRALLAGSPAIDKGSNALAQQNGTPLRFDQRGPGHPRIFGASVDIGAMEYSPDSIFDGDFETGP